MSKKTTLSSFPPDSLSSEERKRQKQRKRLIKDIFRVLIVVVFFVLMGFIFKDPAVREHFRIDSVRDFLHPDASGLARFQSYLLFILIAAPLISIGVPRLLSAAIAGTIYGAFIGTLVALVASLLASAGTYLIGSSMLKSTVKRRSGKMLAKWRDRLQRHPFQGTLYLRLIPVMNATLTSLICGASRIRMGPYLLANALGFLPLTIVFATFGSAAAKDKPRQMLFGVVLFIVAIAGQYAYTRLKKKEAPADPDAETAEMG